MRFTDSRGGVTPGKGPLEIRREAPAEHMNPPKAAEDRSAPTAAEKKQLAAVLLATAAIRLLIAAFAPLYPDETYYWDWSRHLATGYYDHPPLIAWLIRVGTTVFGDTPIGVRFGSVAAGIIATVIVAATARRIAGHRAALLASVILAVMPLSAAGLVLAAPDAPLLACVAAVSYCVIRVLGHAVGSRESLLWWCLGGVALGLACLAKYTAVLVPAGLGIALLSRAEWRPRLREAGPYLAIVIASIVFLPAFLWNARHDWLSFTFQLQHGLADNGGSIGRSEAEFIGGQLGLVSPILLAMMLLAIAVAVAARSPARPSSLLATIALFVFVFFIYSATKRRPEANWPAVGYVPAILALVAHERSRRWDRWLYAGIATASSITLVVYVHTFLPIAPVSARSDITAKSAGWEGLASAVHETSQSLAAAATQPRFIAGNRYQEASELAFHLPGRPQTLSLNLVSRPNQYDQWPSFADRAKPGASLILVVDDGEGPPEVVALTPHFDTVRQDAGVTLTRRGDVVKYLRIWTLLGWRGTWPTPLLRSRP